MSELEKIQIRSEEVQDILGAAPKKIIRVGISVIFVIVMVLLVGSYFFKYPDIINSKVVVTTKNPPAVLQAKASGKITHLFYKEAKKVDKDEIIAVIENSGDYSQVIKLDEELKIIKSFKDSLRLSEYNNLGSVQSSYAGFIRLIKDYKSFMALDYYNQKIKTVKLQIHDQKLYYDRLWKQRNIQEKELKLAEQQFERDKQLFEKGVHSQVDFEKAQKALFQQQMSFESSRTTLAGTQMRINELEQQILDIRLQKSQEEDKREIALEEAYRNLQAQIENWKQSYLVVAPISGTITFTKIWSELQNVQAGESVATIIPENESTILGRIMIPAVGAGKVRKGQKVNIKLDNFPHMEYGIIRSRIGTISLVPEMTEQGAFYMAEVNMQDSLISNYGKKLKFSQEMTGSAEIITDDIRLIERFLNPLKSLWKKNVDDQE